MMKRQADMLDNLVDQLAHDPVVRLSKRQLRHLYEVDRLGKNSWRDLFDRLPTPLDVSDLYVIEEGDEIILIRKNTLREADAYI
jgi:hypothetical protein